MELPRESRISMAQSPLFAPATVSRPRPVTLSECALTSVGADGSLPWQCVELSEAASTEGSGVVSVKLQLPLIGFGLGFGLAFASAGVAVSAAAASAATATVVRRFITEPFIHGC